MKRRNYAPNTVKNYLNIVRHFVVWLDVPVEKRKKPKTVNCHINGIRQFYHYLREDEGMAITNPIRRSHMNIEPGQLYTYKSLLPVRRVRTT